MATTDTATIRRGLLSFIGKKGGSIPMRELHTYSLVMYQAGHQAFSQVMEGLVDEKLASFDAPTNTFHLTETGRHWLDAPVSGQT